jgi:murein DD-endopeptidase MepM/ murein hydrolase activator NlpD
MSVEETPAEEDPLHRPLPSVDMPLLRHQRRDVRLRQVALVAAAVAVTAAAVVAFVVLDFGSAGATEESAPPDEESASLPADVDAGAAEAEDAAADETAAAEPAPPPDPENGEPTALGAVSRDVTRFGNSRGFRDAMIAAGASAEEYDELEDALEDVMDFRRCRPEDILVFERDTDGDLVLFEYRGSSVEYYQVTRARNGDLRGEKVEVPIETRRVAAGGRVQTSLGAAFEEAGLGRALIGRFIEAFEGKVNFNTQARQGDTFRIIAEEERINGEFYGWGTVHAAEYVGERAGELRAFWFVPQGDDEGQFFEEDGRAVRGGWLRTPVQYDRISSRFDLRRMHPILHRIHPHTGVDYAAGSGTPVWAAADGTVTFIGPRGANGNLVALRHANGYESFYAHLSRFARGLSRGDTVEQRQVIGYVGSTGRSTGPHLHFGLKRNGTLVDPLEEINGPGRMMARRNRGRYRAHVNRLKRELARIEVGGSPAGDSGGGSRSDEGSAEEPMD